MHMDTDTDDESEIYSMASVREGTISSSATSYEVDRSMRSASPASVISVTSTAELFRREYGRDLNNWSDVYHLPADSEEFDRLEKQHAMFVELMGGKYVPPMAEVMADDIPGERKACLDLGCGSGRWIIDVARDFPACSAVAVDLIPMQISQMPRNLRSEVDDINLGLEHFFGDFNVVHARLISSGIRDYHLLIDQISRVLRPRGLIDISEFDFHLYDKDHKRIELSTNELGPPWWARWMTFMNVAVRAKGGDVDAATHLYDWVKRNKDFEDVHYQEFFLPIVAPIRSGPDDTEFYHRLDAKVKEDVTAFLGAGRPLLLKSGMKAEIIKILEDGAKEEMELRQYPQYTRLQCVWARKKAA